MTGQGVPFPEAVERMVTPVSMPGPTPEEYIDLLSQIVRDVAKRQHVDMTISNEEIKLLVRHLAGLTLMESEKILTKAIIEDGKLAVDDIRHVIEAKVAVVEKDGLLEYYPMEAALANIADLRRLKAWLAKRKAVVTEPGRAEEFGLNFPRGMLLLGVPGCGKSLSAKAVAAEWRLPLLKLDPSNLYNKYIGESERNFKRAMRTAEQIAPVVLWIDELEKAFAAGGSEDGGVSQRILGSFLTWMQDRTGDVFIVATANDISRLPAEFLRKGRFDEIFFVDLPDAATRAEIFQIHLENRGKGEWVVRPRSSQCGHARVQRLRNRRGGGVQPVLCVFRDRRDHDRIPLGGGGRDGAPLCDPSGIRRRATLVGQGESQAG